ncbi:MAG: AAA family ATPase [Hyphomicrobium sp.]
MFWRAKSGKPGDAPASVDATVPTVNAGSTAPGAAPDALTNVVSLVPQKLSDRLADMVTGGGASTRSAKDFDSVDAPEVLRTAISQVKPGGHILVLSSAVAEACRAVIQLAEIRAETLEAPPDWIYVPDADRPGRLDPISLPHAEGARFVGDANAALEKSAAMFDRLVAADDHRLSLELLDEEFRRRSDAAIEAVRRRAESQNIAVIKSLSGYVLAPIHDGRAVRPEVFRSLPEGLQRDVEAKISALELELQNVVTTSPESEMEADDKHAALIRKVARRAVKPNLAVLKKMYAHTSGVAGITDRLEQIFEERAVLWLRNPASRTSVASIFGRSLGALIAEGAGGAPVVVSRGTSVEDLTGEIGRDVFGAPAIRVGELMRANGGILIVEAWRLAAMPQIWAVLSAALDGRTLQPRPAAGIVVTAEPAPLSLTLIVVADPGSWKKLEAIDPGAAHHFAKVAHVAAAEAGSSDSRSR